MDFNNNITNLKSDEEIENQAYQRLIELVDKNGDGVIDFEEFKEIMEDIET